MTSHAFPSGEESDQIRIARLADIASRFKEPPPIFTGGDEGLRFLNENRGELAGVVTLDLAPQELVAACAEKAAFSSLAHEKQLPVPQSWIIDGIAELDHLAAQLIFPVFLKPTHTRYWQPLVGKAVPNAKGCVVGSYAELVTIYGALARHGGDEATRSTVIQEYVDGTDDTHYSVIAYRHDTLGVTRAFVGRKLHVYPPHAGLGVFVVSESHPKLVELCHVILGKLAYTGIADLDFKRDARSGQFKLLEINCRYSMWNELAMRAGCNMAIAGYAAMTDQSLPQASQRDGVAWFDLKRDVQSVKVYRREAGWSWIRYLLSLRQVRSGPLFALDDLGPVVHSFLRRDGA